MHPRRSVFQPPQFDRHGNHKIPVEDAEGQFSDLRVWSKHHGQVKQRIFRVQEVRVAEHVDIHTVTANNAFDADDV